jgi:carbonic anhydrase
MPPQIPSSELKITTPLGAAMFPDDLLKRNQAFATKRQAQPLPELQALDLALVACFDPRLNELLRPALGLASGEGFMLRTAGALVAEGSTALRSLAMAVLMFDIRQVFVLGHSTCRMASFKSNEFIETFGSRGVQRSAFGTEDLRTWAGAIPNPREGVKQSLAAISAAPFIPADILLAGGVLDDKTGRIELIARPSEVRKAGFASLATQI